MKKSILSLTAILMISTAFGLEAEVVEVKLSQEITTEDSANFVDGDSFHHIGTDTRHLNLRQAFPIKREIASDSCEVAKKSGKVDCVE